ncbi:MAG: adenylyltransferase/cytidyltransferase family protein [Parcubacteria group bacterium]
MFISNGVKQVIVFGTFDIFHKGHMSFLRQAKKYGDFLLVVIARDRIVKKVKRKLPRNNEKNRLKTVENSGLADEVVLGHLRDMYAFIKKYKPDVIALGYDQTAFVDKLEEKLLSMDMKSVRIIRLKSYRPNIYKSSKLI